MATKSRTGNQFTISNQLSLFSELTDAELSDNLIEESIDDRNDYTHTTGTQDPGTLETPSPDDGREPGERESASAGGFRSAGVDGEPAIRIDGGSKDGLPIRVGDRDEGMGVPPGRGGPAPLVVRSNDPRPAPTLAGDLRITPAHAIGEGGLKQKAQANLAAIRTLKTIEAQNRPATPEEKAALVKYTGWGATPNIFASQPSPEWQGVADELKELLSVEEYASARASTPNAHYTSPEVIRAIWQAMERFGLKPGTQILEPSMGVGHFFGMMPEGLYPGTRRTGVELDSTTARIAAKLYPDSSVHAKGFEDAPLPKNSFDAAIGNIPFGNYPIYDPAYRRSPHLTRSIHDYFFAKTLDVIRPGGVIALITSRYTMDKEDSAVRRHLSDESILLGAMRLPNTAFRANAGTDVTTDILFLQKRSRETPAAGEAWIELRSIETPDGPVEINEYFARNPEMMLGHMGMESGQYGMAPALIGNLQPGALERAVSLLPAAVYKNGDRQTPALGGGPDQVPAVGEVKEGGLAELDGQIVVRRGNSFEPVPRTVSASARIRGMLQVRDAVREVFRTQLSDAPDSAIVEARRHLNRTYDFFASRFGPLNARENVKAFADDPDLPLLVSLEEFDPETRRATKTAIFDRRTLERYRPVERVETASEALLVSLNETGEINWARMESLTGKRASDLQDELGSLAYRNPEGAAWETADRYLSGNVRAKLAVAQASEQIDSAYHRNVEALQAVQPKDLEPGEIEARLGSSWIPPSDIRDFVTELLDVPRAGVKIGYAETIATWAIELDYGAKFVVNNTTTHGTARFRASELIEQSLNGRTPTAYGEDADGNRIVNQPETIAAREKQQQLKDRFRDWVWEDRERAARLAQEYNFRFNNLRLRDFDGSHLTLPGMVRTSLRDGDLAPHQKDAVWRILQGGSPLLAHVVGAGKTWTMAAAAMELRRLDLAKKPMFVVPNHLVDQWGAEFLKLYPQARLFVAGKDHFETGNRQQAMARIATGNYDAVIVSHRSFEFLPVSDKYFNRFVEKQVAELDAEISTVNDSKGDNRRMVKELEKAKKRLIVRLKKRADRDSKDRTMTFEELGVDQLFVDEADLYKNLAYVTKMTRIAGLPNSDSNRAFDMFLKIRYLQESSDGRGVVFATGTPISNTLAEMYTMLRYLGPEMLSERKVDHFDAWAANFAEPVTSLELAPDGSGYRMHTRFAKFINLPELLSVFRTVADVQTADMLNLPRPTLENGKPTIQAAPASPELKAFIRTLTERAERLKKERVDPAVDNMLKITGEGRKAALDMRLIDPRAEPEMESKIDRAVSRIVTIWKATEGERSTQLVFSDLSTPDPQRFNVYHDVRSKLVNAGVPAAEIAFIHDAETDTAKKVLFDGVNAGRVRILLGSTEKMGAGTNVQRRLVALHHLDAPWRPRDIEQREGRILRQGNTNKEVQIFRYVTEGSFDAYMWQTLETKARFIQQVMRGETSVRSAEDLESGALTYAEIKAIASGNPAVVEKIKIDTEVRKLDQLRAVHANQQRHIRWEIRDLPRQIAEAKQHLAAIDADIATRNASDSSEFTMMVGNRIFSGKGAREEAAKALTFTILSWRDDQTMQPRVSIRGFEILSRGKSGGFGLLQEDERVPELFIRGRATYSANLNATNPVGTVQSIEHALRNLDKLAAEQQNRVARIEKELADYQSQAHRPFEHEERLKQLLARQSELNSLLDLDKGDQQAGDSASDVKDDPQVGRATPAISRGRDEVAKRAEAYMRASGTAIREMPIAERAPPQTGPVSGRAVAKDEAHIAVATAANSFFVVPSTVLGRNVEIGERLSLRFHHGRASIDDSRDRAR
jgi:N12 class adenine-specific DNA methylase